MVASAWPLASESLTGEAWGAGLGNVMGTPTPIQISGDHVFTELAAGNEFTCGLDTTGRVWCW